MRKKLLLGFGLVVLLLAVLATPFLMAFAGSASPTDGADLGNGARLVLDRFAPVYVIPTGEREVTLVDCGVDPQAAAVRAELKRRGLTDDAVTHIFLTHAHTDHLGGCAAFPKAALALAAAERPLFEGTPAHRSPLQHLLHDQPSTLTVATWLQDGQPVQVGEKMVRTFVVPGHTDGSAAYLIDGVLYVGDSQGASSAGGVRFAPWVFSADQAQNVQSMKALAQKAEAEHWTPRLVAFGHTAPLDGAAWLKATLAP